MSCGELDLVIRWQNDIAHVENTAWWYNGISGITLSTKEYGHLRYAILLRPTYYITSNI